MIILLVVVIVIFAIIGMMEGVFFISIIMQRSMQSHIHMLQKASLTEQFIVEDLCGENGCRSVRTWTQRRPAHRAIFCRFSVVLICASMECVQIADVLAQPREAPDMERGAR